MNTVFIESFKTNIISWEEDAKQTFKVFLSVSVKGGVVSLINEF